MNEAKILFALCYLFSLPFEIKLNKCLICIYLKLNYLLLFLLLKPEEKNVSNGKENTTPIREDSIPEEKVESTVTIQPEQLNFITKTACSNADILNNYDRHKTKNGNLYYL